MNLERRTLNPLRYDVAVVGAGPAGSWAATLLARQGAAVALIDASHPREKPCGGGVTGRALALLGGAIGPLPSVRVSTARFLDERTGQAATVSLDDEATALVVASRTEFDGLLYAAALRAGAAGIDARAVDLRPKDGGFTVALHDGRRIEAGFVVGADGANSLVRRRLSTPFHRGQLSAATGFFARGVTSDEIVLEMTSNPPGYIWSFPRPDHLAIGVCAQADAGVSVSAMRERVRGWIDRTALARGARLDPYSWPIPSLGPRDFGSLAVSGRGWMTIGDAAGLVDPITREGIFFALQSASFAADALASSSGDPAAAFTTRVGDEILGELARAARYKAGFFRPRFAGLLVGVLQASAPIRDVMADLVAGAQSYRELKWRLARTREFGLAWKVLTGYRAM